MSSLPPFELVTILDDMRRTLEARLYYPAILVALTIPDICMGLMLAERQGLKPKHYVYFVDTYTTPRELGMTGDECYQLRSGAVHRGDLSAHSKFDGTHVIFTTPETPGHIHALSMEANGKRAAMFDLELFCGAMVAAAMRWYDANKDNPLIEQNVPRLLRLCPNGLSPFVGGGPVVASGD